MEMVEDYASQILDAQTLNYYKDFLKQNEYVEATDYSALINVNRRRKFSSQQSTKPQTSFWGDKFRY